jgi:hypothetical protein
MMNVRPLTVFALILFLQVEQMLNSDKLDDFLTTVCYPFIMTPFGASTSKL